MHSSASVSFLRILPAILTGWMFFLLCYVSRVEPGVIANELMGTFNMTASTFGVVSSCFYITYVAMQIPTGVLLDKFGSRAIISSGALLSAVATFVFGSAQSVFQLQMGRFILGVATASGFIGCTKLISELIPPQQYSIFVGITLFAGCIGGICGGTPTAWLVSVTGWRETTFIIAGFGILISLLAFFCMPPLSRQFSNTSQNVAKNMLDGLKILAKNPRYWTLGIFCAISYLPMTAIAELWCIPFVGKKFALSTADAAVSSMSIFIGYGFGSIITPCLANKLNSCKKVLLIFKILTIVVFLPIIYWDGMPFRLCLLLLFLFGVFGGTVPLFFTMAYNMVPRQYGGSSSGFTNMMNMSGAIVFQPLLGKLLDSFRNGLIDADGIPLYTFMMYKNAFFVVWWCMALSIFLLFFIDDFKRK
ncbi:MAG: MFS transporter [Puniceicoccales bacterium]|jgi:sugar phosphate permease|nr:MFS transporter [Puniceicoccales bacterium]